MKNAFSTSIFELQILVKKKITVISLPLSRCDFHAYQMDFWSHDVKNFIFGKTAITHSFVTLKTPVKSKVILDIIFKGLIHNSDTGHNKNG